ncbi:MAG: hypothetical protein WC714_28970 [Candidatus Obscuribacterales bacterium]|jgi:hypothetical protein
MTDTIVFPGAPDPTYDIGLSDGTTTYRFKFAGGPRTLQEIPLSPPAQKFSVEQRNFVGGRGSVRLSEDATAYNDSAFAWTTSNRVFPTPQWRFTIRADADMEMPGDNSTMAWRGLYPNGTSNYRYLSRPFTAASGSTAADKAYIFVRKVGSPGTLTLEYCIDNAGSPSTAQKTVTKTITDIPDTPSVFCVFDWTGTTTRTSGTVYHIKVYGASTDTVTNHWEVLTGSAETSVASSDNLTWVAARCSLYFRVTGFDSARQWKWFNLEGGTYAVSVNDNRTAPYLFLNGARGTVKSATGTTLVSTTASVAANQFQTGTGGSTRIRIYDGTGDGQIRTITSNTATTGGDVEFTVPTWDVTPDTTSRFVVYGTDSWTLATGSPSLTHVTGQPIVGNGIAYFPRGTATGIYDMRVSGDTHQYRTEATLCADLLYPVVDAKNGLSLYAAWNAASVVYEVGAAAWATDMGTPKNTHTIGFSDYKITNMFYNAGTIFVMKEDGKYIIDGKAVSGKGANFRDVPATDNGRAVGADDKYMWWGWGHSVIRSIGDNDTDMLNFRQGYEGLPADRRGVCTCIVSAIGWMFFVFDGGADNYSTIMMWNGFGWHEIFRGWATGVRVRNAYWQANMETRPRLWFDVNGEMAYMEFPLYAANPLKDSTFNYNHEFVLATSTIDINDEMLYKIINNIRAIQESGRTIEVDYQSNDTVGSTVWIPLGTVVTAPGTSTNPLQEVVTQLGKILQIRFRFRGLLTNSRTPPVMIGWATEGRMMPAMKYQYIATFAADTSDEEDYWNTAYAWIQTCAEQQTKLTMYSLNASSDSKVVTVTYPAKSVDWIDESSWGGRVSFAMLEV